MKTLNYETTLFIDNKKTVIKKSSKVIYDNGEEKEQINLYPEMKGQTFEGFGGAFTDAAGYVYSLMNDEDKNKMIHTYFDESELNYTIGRIHMDSCDFSVDMYEAMSNPEDKNLESFSLERTEKYILPLVRDVLEKSGREIEIMVSPWSAPAFMKTNGERCHGGKLKEEYKKMWAEYICRYITEFRKLGLKVTRMSLQNEPKAVQTWDSLCYTAEEEKIFLRDFMYPSLLENGLSDVEIFIWDHNKERAFERACGIIDEETNHMVSGIAFHWYSGDHFEAVGLIREKFPEKKLILSEACIEYSVYKSDDYLNNAQKYAHDIIGNFNNGMNAFYDWNILLDHTGGPNHVGNLCDAPFLFHTEEKKLMERNTLSYIRHFSHFIKPGAVRIKHSRYTDKLDVTAFENPDGEIVCIILNREDYAQNSTLRFEGLQAEVEIPGKSITTVVIK